MPCLLLILLPLCGFSQTGLSGKSFDVAGAVVKNEVNDSLQVTVSVVNDSLFIGEFSFELLHTEVRSDLVNGIDRKLFQIVGYNASLMATYDRDGLYKVEVTETLIDGSVYTSIYVAADLWDDEKAEYVARQ